MAAFIAAFREAVRTDGQEQTTEQRRLEAELRKVRQDLDGLDATARQGRLRACCSVESLRRKYKQNKAVDVVDDASEK